ncbi:MAG TPA: aldo/keto reductase [Streptosporangiaceae bacterium]|nr:aldo/keto reductase [Streptosporangiaceae bacterium]
MRYRSLERSGLRISVLGLGCSKLGSRVTGVEADVLIRSALEAGISLFDTADVYGAGASEGALGGALLGVRDQAVIATKVRWPTGRGANNRGASRIHIMSAVEGSLRHLRTDLYQVHAPDPTTPVEETLATTDHLVTSGKVRYVGMSNFGGWQLADAYWRAVAAGHSPVISTQSPYSLLDLRAEAEILPAARRLGIMPQHWRGSGSPVPARVAPQQPAVRPPRSKSRCGAPRIARRGR